jgi:hypothetical protein
MRASPVETGELTEEPDDDCEDDNMKMTLEQPDNADIKANVGIDRVLGWFCTVREKGRLRADYDGIAEGYDGLQGLLKTLIAHGWFTRDDLEEAIRVLPHLEPEEMDDPGVAPAAEIYERLKEMGAD